MALLMVAPSRCSELMSLSVNCLEWEEDSLGNKQLGIRWIPAKNGKEGLKWDLFIHTSGETHINNFLL